jgi:SRSO17 transposase
MCPSASIDAQSTPLSDLTQTRLRRELFVVEQRLKSHFPSYPGTACGAGEQACRYLEMLLAPVERKNSWQLAEASGQKNPYAFQHLLGKALWNSDAVRDDHLAWMGKKLKVNDPVHPQGTLVLDDTGFLKKGEKSAGVSRQYSGTAGRIENSQIGVFLSLLTPNGTRVLLDRELYLPQEWTNDPERCREAHIPSYRIQHHQSKNALGLWMLKRARMAGIRPAWVTGDEVYGKDSHLRLWLQEVGQPYVLAVASNHYFWVGPYQMSAKEILAAPTLIKLKDWKRLSCGMGSKGLRIYDWALLRVNLLQDAPQFLLMRRNPEDPIEIEFYHVHCHPKTPLTQIVQAAGTRWSVEECFETSKGEVGLDQYEVRSYTGWYRHITLAMIAHATLALTRTRFVKLDQWREARKKKPRPAMAVFLESRGLWPKSA